MSTPALLRRYVFGLASALSGLCCAEEQLIVSSNEPTYFIVGHHHDSSARFQFSFKYKLFDADSVPTKYLPPLNGMHLAYTQTSLWDLSADSKPFRDTSYRPALLYEWAGEENLAGHSPWGLQVGFEHESNGRGAPSSRSSNALFLHPIRRMELATGKFIELGVRLFGYLEREENPDILRYRGIADYQVSFGKDDGVLWRSTTRAGTEGRGSFQLDLSYPLRRQYFANTGGYYYAQYFYGYGETLFDYKQRSPSQLRVGFAVVR